MANAPTYSLLFQNQSQNSAAACVYQQDPGLGIPGVMPLAWLVQPVSGNAQTTFHWTSNYNFIWAASGPLLSGTVVEPGQTPAADVQAGSQVTLTRQASAYTFVNQASGPLPGNLVLRCDGSIPASVAAVGIGMSGAGTFAVQAQPNASFVFTPDPTFWITFGTLVQGEAVDPAVFSARQVAGGVFFGTAPVVFPPQVFAMTATLSATNTWTVAPAAS